MLGGAGVYRGSSVLISGRAGTGKSSLGSYLVDAACRRGERCLYFSFEESPSQIVRNMHSIGLDLTPWVQQNLLRFHATRPSAYGLEMHLATLHKLVNEFKPRVVVIDPITSFLNAGSAQESEGMLMRLIDFLKAEKITAVFTSLTRAGDAAESSQTAISSLIDTWLLVREVELDGERNRGLYVLKSRGMAHSNRIREFVLSDQGIALIDVHFGPDGILIGSRRKAAQGRGSNGREKKTRAKGRRR
jgi:circadian clock protein KaiC